MAVCHWQWERSSWHLYELKWSKHKMALLALNKTFYVKKCFCFRNCTTRALCRMIYSKRTDYRWNTFCQLWIERRGINGRKVGGSDRMSLWFWSWQTNKAHVHSTRSPDSTKMKANINNFTFAVKIVDWMTIVKQNYQNRCKDKQSYPWLKDRSESTCWGGLGE